MSPRLQVNQFAASIRVVAFFAALLLSALPIPSSAAPGPAPLGAGGIPIYVIDLRQVGIPGHDYSPAITGAVDAELRRKASCTDVTSREDVANLLGLAKDQQTLGTPEEQQVKLDEIGAALGRVGVLISGSFGKMGDTYFVNIIATNANGGKMMDNTMVTGKGDDDGVLVDLVEQAVSKLDLKVCRPKWTGTITVTKKSTYTLQKPGYMPVLANATRNPMALEVHYTTEAEELGVRIPSYVGTSSDPGKMEATLTSALTGSGFIYNLATQEVDCSGSWSKQMRREYEWQNWISETTQRWDDTRRATRDITLAVNIDRNGHYKISWTAPGMKYKKVIQSFARGHPSPCKGPENYDGALLEGEFDSVSRSFVMEGDVDPKNPNELIGSISVEEPSQTDASGSTFTSTSTRKWQLTADTAR